jgi:flagellar protein FlaG
VNLPIGKISAPVIEPAAVAVPTPDNAPAPQQAAPAQTPPPAQPPLGAEAAKQVARQINDFLKSSGSNVEFRVDQETKAVIVRVVDAETNTVIRQIPSEEMVAISHSLDQMSGLLLKQKA